VADIYTIYSTVHSERVYIPEKDCFSQGGGGTARTPEFGIREAENVGVRGLLSKAREEELSS
jgi:hypothetical protein